MEKYCSYTFRQEEKPLDKTGVGEAASSTVSQDGLTLHPIMVLPPIPFPFNSQENIWRYSHKFMVVLFVVCGMFFRGVIDQRRVTVALMVSIL